jgi:hypothetical protein
MDELRRTATARNLVLYLKKEGFIPGSMEVSPSLSCIG